MTVRWRFDDPTNGDFYLWEINASEGGSPPYQKNVVVSEPSAQDGHTIIMEGADQAQQLDLKGTILSQAQYDAMILWFTKRHAVQLTDDLGRVSRVYFTDFTPVRQRAVQYPWKHSWTAKMTVLN